MPLATRGLVRDVLLVVCGAGAGALAGWVAATRAPRAADVSAPLAARVVELEQRLARVALAAPRRRRVGDAPAPEVADVLDAPGHLAARPAGGGAGGGGASASAGGGGAAAEGGGEGRATVSGEFVRSVRSALDEIRREDERAGSLRKLRDDRARYLRDLERRLTSYQELLGLPETQVDALRTTAQEGMDELLRARARGVGGDELAALERALQREMRDVVGGATYRDMRKLLIDEVARPVIVSVSGSAGVDKAQRDRIERLLDEHIESIVDLDVRSSTEEIAADERRALRERIDVLNQAAWDRLRNEILDAEQRDRVPQRLR